MRAPDHGLGREAAIAIWWSNCTLTTVGYGDVFPVTPIGKILAGLTAITGIGLIAMPTGILAAAFSDAIRRQQAAEIVEVNITEVNQTVGIFEAGTSAEKGKAPRQTRPGSRKQKSRDKPGF